MIVKTAISCKHLGRIIAAVAGMIVSESVEREAQKAGFFVIKQRGDTVAISNKPDFKPKEWKLK